MTIPDQPKTITIKQTDYDYLKYLIESLAADLPYNQTAKRALKTIQSTNPHA
jgi:hypothetical protein